MDDKINFVSSLGRPIFISSNISNLIEKAQKGELTRQELEDMNYPDLLEIAAYYPIKDLVKKFFNMRGFILKKPFKILDHQIDILVWMKDVENECDEKNTYGMRGGIVSLKMGLGKTLISLAHTLSRPKGEFPDLIIVSKTIMNEWKTQGIEKFFPGASALYFHKDYIGLKEMQKINRSHLIKYDVVISTYDTLLSVDIETLQNRALETSPVTHKRTIRPAPRHLCNNPLSIGMDILYNTPWNRIICDESQRFSNYSTKTCLSVMALHGKYRWCLSGTPIKNYKTDIWTQLVFCGFEGITEPKVWMNRGLKFYREANLSRFVANMDYKEANIELPMKTEYLVPVKLSGRQKQMYNFMLGEVVIAFRDALRRKINHMCVLALFTRLRQICIAPYLINHILGDEDKNIDVAERMERIKNEMEKNGLIDWIKNPYSDSGIESSKYTEIMKIIKSTDEKIVIFSMFTSALDLMRIALEKYNVNYVQIDGKVSGKERNVKIKKFKNDSNIKVLLAHYKTCGEGVNLTEATVCILLEPWWTNSVHNQAKTRIWRMGQKKEVTIYNIITEDSIEYKILDICSAKDKIGTDFLDGDISQINKIKSGLDRYTLGKILGIYNNEV